jgi:hypothetical protein
MPHRSLPSPRSFSRRTVPSGDGAAPAAQEAASATWATPSAAGAELADLIRAIERERLRALVEANMAVAEQLHVDDFQLINPGGGALTKEEYLGGVASGEIDYLVWEPDSEIAVRLYDGAAAIRYRSNTEIVVEGKGTSSGTGTPIFTNSTRVCGKRSGLKPPKSDNRHAEGSRSGHAKTASSITAERNASRLPRFR